MKPIEHVRLYAFIDEAYLHGRAPEGVARELCAGGADLIQLRAKKARPEQIRQMAEAILPVTRAAGVPLVINDHLEVARQVSAEWVHLGQEDFFDAGYRQVTELVPADALPRIGLSTHAPDQAERAIAAGAHYIAIGPVFPTGTKPGVRPVTLDYVRWAAGQVRLPWFAIGGINLDNLDSVLEAGARRVCAVSAILNAPDVADACRQFKERLSGYPLAK